MNNYTVSILAVTYNHEKYIAKMLDSVLMQEVNFKYEIVIGEDFSSDNTRKILMQYKDKYSEKIKLILNEKNLGLHKNTLITLKACTGKYIAWLEGDDYWTSKMKLQKQVEFLEKNEEYSACAHLTETKYDFRVEKKKQFYLKVYKNNIIRNKDLLDKIIIHTSSLLFRNELLNLNRLEQYPVLVQHSPIMIILSTVKPIKLFPEIMSVYRKNLNSISENIKAKEIYYANINAASSLNKYLDHFLIKSLYMKGVWSRYYLLQEINLSYMFKIKLFLYYSFFSFYIFPKNIKQILSTIYQLLIHGKKDNS